MGASFTISASPITDRCNYKCVYCRTGEMGAQYPELGIEEYLRLIKLFVGLGIEKVRLTGGEPLLRHGLARSDSRAGEAAHPWLAKPLDLALTTNGHLLEDAGRAAEGGRAAARHGQHGRRGAPHIRADHAGPGELHKVLAGIRAARDAGSDAAEDQLRAAARLQRRPDRELCASLPAKKTWWCASSSSCRLKKGRLWTPEIVVPLEEIVDRIGRVLPLDAAAGTRCERNGTALYLCRRARRDRDHCAGDAGLLRGLQPGAAHLGRQDPDMPVFAGRARSLWAHARRGEATSELRSYIARTVQGKEARHHIGEPEIPQAVALDGAHRRMSLTSGSVTPPCMTQVQVPTADHARTCDRIHTQDRSGMKCHSVQLHPSERTTFEVARYGVTKSRALGGILHWSPA